jgi:hypothetical protein
MFELGNATFHLRRFGLERRDLLLELVEASVSTLAMLGPALRVLGRLCHASRRQSKRHHPRQPR